MTEKLPQLIKLAEIPSLGPGGLRDGAGKKGELENALRKTAKDELRKSKNSKTVAEDARKAAKQVENNSSPNPRTMCD